MKFRTVALAGSVAMGLAGSAPAWADQTFTGSVSVVDRTTGEIVVKRDAPKQGSTETVGSAAAGETAKFKMRDPVPETLHAGEKVTVTYTESNGVNIASKVNEQKD